MRAGWVKLHRKLLDNELLRTDVAAKSVFVTLLLLCDKKTGTGSFGRELLGYYCGLKPITAYKAFLRLKKANMVTQSSNNRFTQFSICNWSEYQADGNKRGNNEVTTKEQRSNTLQEGRSRSKNIVSKETSEVASLYYQYLKKYRIPVTNHNVLRTKINELEKLNGEVWAVRYLKFMLDEYEHVEMNYKPQINSALDLFTKAKNIENKLKLQHKKMEIY